MNPSARYTSALVHQVARELALAGWKLKAVFTDNGSEFRSQEFRGPVLREGSSTPLHPRWPAPEQRLRGTGAAPSPRGVLVTHLRPLTDPQVHRPAPGPGPLPALLQLRPGPHRTLHRRTHPGPTGLWCQKDAPTMSRHCYTSHALFRLGCQELVLAGFLGTRGSLRLSLRRRMPWTGTGEAG